MTGEHGSDSEVLRELAWFRGDCPMADNVYPEECCDEPDQCREIADRMRAKDAAAARERGTASAIGPNGRTIFFDDLVKDGEVVEVVGRRMVVRYDPLAPDWFVDDEDASVVAGAAGDNNT